MTPDNWHVTACAHPDGRRWTLVPGEHDLWQGPDGDPVTGGQLDELGPLTVAEVANPHALVCELEAYAEAVDNLTAERKAIAADYDRLLVAATWANRALAGARTKCDEHGDQPRPLALCCRNPRDVVQARRLLAEVLPPSPPDRPVDVPA